MRVRNRTARRICRYVLLALLAALVAMPAMGQANAPACIYALSKDLCNAVLDRGLWSLPVCPDPTVPTAQCHTLAGSNAHLTGPLISGTGTCGTNAEVRCDETPEINGTFVVTGLDLRTQRHSACVGRGHWHGKWALVNQFGLSIAEGNLWATLGVGTHRKNCSDANHCNTAECEECHDVIQLPSPVYPPEIRWQIGSEGHLDGRVVSGRFAGCTVHASMHGNFIANGDSRGPQAPDEDWDFCGNIDGVLECPCPDPDTGDFGNFGVGR